VEGHSGGSPPRSSTGRVIKPGVNESHQQHRLEADRLGSLGIAVVTVSDTRSAETDVSGRFLTEQIRQQGHRLVDYRLVADEPSLIEETLNDLLQTDAQVLLLNGGTGISSRDGTFEIVNRHLEKVLPGFGELFRMLSFHEIGAAAMLSRATAGICAGRILVSLPGSPAAVRLAWEKLLQPELRHLVREASR
jgi:molybdenum cofactor biosynthesis protein B